MRTLSVIQVLLIAGLMSLRAEMSNAQVLEKRVSVSYDNQTLDQVVLDLQRRTNAEFAFMGSLGLSKIQVSKVNFTERTLGEILRILLGEHGLSFFERQGTIFITAGQPRSVTGKVMDSQGHPLAGATIAVKGSPMISAVSEADGGFKLAVPSGTELLVVSFIGYLSQEVPLTGTANLTIRLLADAQVLEDVVVVGYGTQQKSDLTASISQVSGRDIANTTVSNVAMALQGRAAGVEILNNGTPGKTPNIRIRGMGSINATDPLVVLDGVPVDMTVFAQLSTLEIQSIEILKDAASGAIYGTRAANGVILVTTKSGNFNQPTTIRLNASAGVNDVIKRYPVLNGEQLYALKRESFEINGLTVPAVSPWSDNYYNATRTDWQDEFFQLAPYQDYNLAVSGGNDRTTVNANFNYRDEDGTQINSSFERIGFSLKATQKISDRFQLTSSLRLNKNQDQLNYDAQASSGTLFAAYFFHPSIPVKYGNGNLGSSLDSEPFAEGDWGSGRAHNDLGDMWNPVYKATEEWYTNESMNALVNLKATLQITDHLELTGSTAYTYRNAQREVFNKPTPLQSRTIANPVLTKGTASRTSWLGELYATYSRRFGQHDLVITGGTTAQTFDGEDQEMRGEGFASLAKNHLVLNNADVLTGSGSPIDPTALASFFGRANYQFAAKYFLSATVRADGSSRFAKGNRWGYFPAFSAGWRISDEQFMAGLPALSNLKLNVGWGELGNQNVTPFQYLGIYAKDQRYIIGGRNVTGTRLQSFANRDITWEKSATTNVLLEIGLFEQALKIDAAYFDKRTQDMLIPSIRQLTMGNITIPNSNIGDIRNHGFEFEVSAMHQFDDNTYLNVGANASLIKNKLIKLNGENSFLSGNGPTRSYEGGELSAFYGWKTAGIYQTQEEIQSDPNIANDSRKANIAPGDVRFLDLNGDGRIGDEDRTNIGDPNPFMSYGFFIQVDHGPFSLSANFSGRLGYEVYDAIMMRNIQANQKFNMHANALERWTGPGSTEKWPRLTRVSANENYRESDLAVTDASYLRLKDLVVGYQLANKRLAAIGVKQARLFLAGRNLLTLTGANIVDPEENSGFSNVSRGIIYTEYPQSKTYTFGLDLTF
ncbi:SusC/RagA family TonB-linked outer membrane protein [Parapedobacter sp. GCM10030251]|uniref:SusC/RagA family TonB-linked outer membrane protein n=1 Tax=Parapedobacter sp. GCM10030251 TaxID=3273419 RepID=UPI00360D47E4